MATGFGFTVRHPLDYEWKDGEWVGGVDHDRFVVSLPHQCDRWEITDDTQEIATVALEKFIAEAQAALEMLKAGQVTPED